METESEVQMSDNNRRPAHEIRYGSIKAVIWQNATNNGAMHNVTVARIYKDGDQWKDSTSFGRDDLPLVMKVADLVHSWIFQQASAPTNGSATDQSDDEAHF